MKGKVLVSRTETVEMEFDVVSETRTGIECQALEKAKNTEFPRSTKAKYEVKACQIGDGEMISTSKPTIDWSVFLNA